MAKKLKRALRKAAKVALPMLAVAGLGKAFMNNRNRRAMLEGADANAVNVTGGSQLTPTDATYEPATGILTITFGSNHGLTNSNTVTLDNNSFTVILAIGPPTIPAAPLATFL